jgi:hypothetical protein
MKRYGRKTRREEEEISFISLHNYQPILMKESWNFQHIYSLAIPFLPLLIFQARLSVPSVI